MHKNYVVLAHTGPSQVMRLVRRLGDADSTVWLHLDAAVSIDAWGDVLAHPAVRLVEPRTTCVWGTWSIVAATLTALAQVVREGRPGHVVLLSGQCYPLRSNADIDRRFDDSPKVHMEVDSLPSLWPDNYGHRLHYLNIPVSERPGDYLLVKPWRDMNPREAIGWGRRLVRELGWRRAVTVSRLLARRRPDVADKVRGGSQWWAMPWDVVVALLDFEAAHPELQEFLRWAHAPDELFFQTVVSSMYGEALAGVLASSPTHVDWTPGDWDLPRVLVADDVPLLSALDDGILFARKFDGVRSAEALEMIDLQLDRPAPGGAT